MIIVKQRNASDSWITYHSSLGAGNYLKLDAYSPSAASTQMFDNTAPTASVFSLDGQNDTNGNNDTYIAYCFHSVSGYSKIGSYSGTATSGNTITTGFPVAWVMIKRTDGNSNWDIIDSVRTPTGVSGKKVIRADEAIIEQTGAEMEVELTSTGFKINNTQTEMNASGGTYIYMAFADKREAAFWLDQSGNNNDWTGNNLTESDISVDSPTNNFATWNAIDPTSSTESEGNLKTLVTTTGATTSTIGMSTGKWYAEIYFASGTHGRIGICNEVGVDSDLGGSANGWCKINNPARLYNNGSAPSYGVNMDATEIVMVAFDADTGKIWYGVDGTWDNSSNPTSSSTQAHTATGTDFFFAVASGSGSLTYVVNFGQDSSFAGNKTAQGKQDSNDIGDFYYEPPSGFLALCTKNLPDPAVIPSEHFNTVLYTANESTLSVTGVGFQPDFVWIKSRASTRPHTLFDVIRGVTKELFTNQTSSEETYTASLTAFDSDGFSLGDHWDTNEGTNNHVAWNWKANGTGASNTNGTINTTATSANTDAGFSISTYTGNGTAGATVGHGLSSKPDMMIVKKRSASPSAENWTVYHTSLGATKGTYLNLTSTPYTLDIYWNNTEPTNNVFSIGDWDGINTSGEPYVAYCFHSVDGYSKVGSFEGNASTSGNFIYTGFTPALVILHNVGDGGGWPMMDNARGDYNSAEAGGGHELLRTNSSGIEGDSGRVDLLSNGFRPTVNYGEMNAAFTYVYIAFAESPFKHTNAK
jgi:hypothetical protein